MNRMSWGVLAVSLLSTVVHAADFTWTGGAYVSGSEASRYWDIAGNWSPGGPPAAGQSALISITSNYAIADADLPGGPAIEVAAGGSVEHLNGATLTMPITLSGGLWDTSPWWNSSHKYDGTWQTNRNINGPLTVTAPSLIKGTRGAAITINGQINGNGLLTFQSDDQYLGQGPAWTISHANNPFSGGILLEAGNYPVVWVTASQALGTGDITVRSTGTLVFGANQDYSGASRTPVLCFEGGITAMTDHLSGATIPFNVVVQSLGGTLGAGTWASNCVYSGSVTLNGPLTLAGSRASGGSTSFTITGAISGSYPVIVNTTDQYSGARGIVTLANAGNSFVGLTLQMGYLKATSEGALSSGPITLNKPDTITRLYLDKTPDADWTISNSLSGTGIIQVEGGSGFALNTSGTISPGIGAGNVGTITVQGNLGFASGASVTVDLNATDPLNPVCDLVAVSGTVSNLGSATLSILPTGDASALSGRQFTILTCANDVTGQTFGSVTVPDGWNKVVIYGNGSIKVAVAPNTGTDTVAPAAVADLAAGNATLHSLKLTWTAPGDDGIMGTAASYDIRYSTSTITDANFASATPVAGVPTPAIAGTIQSVVVTGLAQGTTYYFAMKTSDEVPNVSALSNIAVGLTTLPDTTPPAAVTNLTASTPTSSSLTLTWTAPGDDGNTGTASSYDIRYSTSTITDANWDSATQVTGEPTPTTAGTIQSMVVSGLATSTTYYFAVKTSDEVPNISALSNIATGTTSPPDPPQASKPLLTQADFHYKGYYIAQTGGDGNHAQLSELHWGQSFTHRYVNGQLRFLTMSFFGNVPGGGNHLIEFAPPASGLGGTVTTRTNHWPDIWAGTGLSDGGIWMGLWYEQAKERLWTTWAVDYPDDVMSQFTKSLAVRTLNDDGTISNGNGPWGLAGVQQRRIYGGVQAVPQWFQDFYHVGAYAAGWGGYASRMGLGVSLGPTFYTFPDPSTYTPGDIPASDFKTLMDHGGGTTSTDWYAAGHPTSFDRGVRNSDVKNDYDAPNWQSPAPDGVGRWVWGDSNWNTGTWIDQPTRHGFITVPKLSSGRAWYEGSTLHCERQTAEIQVFDPRTLGEVASGTRASWNTYPASRWEITSTCQPLGLMGGIGGNGARGGPAGASYDPITRQLYVYCVWGTNQNSYILIYDVGPLSGDINNDSYVNVGDLQLLVAAWGSRQMPPQSGNWNANADLNGDGFINVGDLQLLVANWGQSR